MPKYRLFNSYGLRFRPIELIYFDFRSKRDSKCENITNTQMLVRNLKKRIFCYREAIPFVLAVWWPGPRRCSLRSKSMAAKAGSWPEGGSERPRRMNRCWPDAWAIRTVVSISTTTTTTTTTTVLPTSKCWRRRWSLGWTSCRCPWGACPCKPSRPGGRWARCCRSSCGFPTISWFHFLLSYRKTYLCFRFYTSKVLSCLSL